MKTTQTIPLSLRAVAAGILAFCATSSPAQVTQMLYSGEVDANATRNNYTGVVGTQFQIGSSNVVVSHLGYYDVGNDGLAVSHQVAVFGPAIATPTILGQVVVPAGTTAYSTNGFRWVQLDPPLLLNSSNIYILGGMAGNLDGDAWQNNFVPTWNPYFVGATGNRFTIYGPGNTTWPPTGLSRNTTNTTYGAASLGYIEVGPAKVGVAATNVASGAGANVPVAGFGTGQQPITYQWFTSGGAPVAGQTNATLVISNATVGVRTYYLTATNGLGGAQSPNVVVTITAFPVGISQHPTNLTAYANYSASFFTTATGTPPISYQWSRNGAPIAGATSSSYSLTASTTNNGEVYSCLVSNNISGTPHTAVSSNATLSVIYNLALPQQLLHGTPTGSTLNRSNYTGTMGGHFTVGASPVTVTHLGYFAPINQYLDASNASLTQNHQVGIFNSAGTTMMGSVTVPAGNSPVINGYIWVALNPSLVLETNTQYLLMAEVFTDVDPYPDPRVVPDLNPYFASACNASYGKAWPAVGNFGNYNSQMYGAPNLGILASGTPTASVAPAAATQYATLGANFTALISGQPPVTVQWYKSPGTLLAGETNSTLAFSNLALSDQGDYFVIASNGNGDTPSGNATLTVLPATGPQIVQDLEAVSAYLHQTVQFSVVAEGLPPMSYEWKYNGNTLPGKTNSTLILTDVSVAGNAGNYQVFITNARGPASSVAVTLTVLTPPAGSYMAAILAAKPLAYYRFSDVSSGYGIATNVGALGFDYNGLHEYSYSATGPTGMSNFEPGNECISLDGLFADVRIPPLGVRVTSATLAAWVYKSVDQVPNAAIYFHRGANVFGLSTVADPTTGGDALRYTWNGNYWDFTTGLILPTNEWALVVASITPNNAALYVVDGSGMRSTNNAATHAAQTFSATNYIGWDTAGGDLGRRWSGLIDEVMVFDRSLSASEVSALYQGVPGNITLTIAPQGDKLRITWPLGLLLEADAVTGPWTTNSAATSPYDVTPSAAKKFYRVKY